MSDPVRWREGADDGSSAARELLRRGGRTPGMTAAEDAALRASVGRIATGLPAVRPRVHWLGAKGIGAVGAACAAVGLAAYLVAHRPLAARATGAPAPRAAHVAPPRRAWVPAWVRAAADASTGAREAHPTQAIAAGVLDAGVVGGDDPTGRATDETPRRAGARGAPATLRDDPAVDTSDVASTDEGLLHAAQSALAQSPPDRARAFALFARHRREFPDSGLTQEREYFWIRALAEARRGDAACAHGDAFLHDFSWSQYAPRVRSEIWRFDCRNGRSFATPAGTVADEIRLLEDARVAMRRGAPLEALALLRTHTRRFPRATFEEQRDLLAIEALAALNRSPEACRRAETFLREQNTSIHAYRVRALAASLHCDTALRVTRPAPAFGPPEPPGAPIIPPADAGASHAGAGMRFSW